MEKHIQFSFEKGLLRLVFLIYISCGSISFTCLCHESFTFVDISENQNFKTDLMSVIEDGATECLAPKCPCDPLPSGPSAKASE